MGNYFFDAKKEDTNFLEKKLSEIRPSVLVGGSVVSFLLLQYTYRKFKEAKNSPKGVIGTIQENLFRTISVVPILSGEVKKLKDKQTIKLRKQYVKGVTIEPVFTGIPKEGMSSDDVLNILKRVWDSNKIDITKVSGAVYLDFIKQKEHHELINKAFSIFSLCNGLHVDLYPAQVKFEREVLKMGVTLFRGGEEGCGVMTLGGTESIFLAVKAYRDMNVHIKHPEILLPTSGHPAFDKACHYLKIKCVRVTLGSDWKVDLKDLERKINKNTIMIVGSAPGYPHGIIDHIDAISDLGLKYKIPVHVDCCLGGFYVPFASRLGYIKEKFDFSAKGVMSISADTHKYGLAPKGTSLLLFRNSKLRNKVFYSSDFWIGGHYATRTTCGSFNEGLIAGTWAAMIYRGMNGYMNIAKGINDTVVKIIKEIRENEDFNKDIEPIGDPKGSVFALTGKKGSKINIYQIYDEMKKKKGWHLNPIQKPDGFHFALTEKNIGIEKKFLSDLKDTLIYIRKNPKAHEKGSVAVYGISMFVPKEVLVDFTDIIFGALLDGK